MRYDRKHNDSWTEISDHADSRKVFMKGAVVVDGHGSLNAKLVSNMLGNVHMPIIKWNMRGIGSSYAEKVVMKRKFTDCQGFFKALCTKRADIGETCFYYAGNGVYSISFRFLNWSDYRRLLFSLGVDRAFRNRTLAAFHAHMPLFPKPKVICSFGGNKHLDRGLKESVESVLEGI